MRPLGVTRTEAECESESRLRAEDEDEMGNLQPGQGRHSAQYRSQEQSLRNASMHRCTQDGAHVGADPQLPFFPLMDRQMLQWQRYQDELNSSSLSHQWWTY